MVSHVGDALVRDARGTEVEGGAAQRVLHTDQTAARLAHRLAVLDGRNVVAARAAPKR